MYERRPLEKIIVYGELDAAIRQEIENVAADEAGPAGKEYALDVTGKLSTHASLASFAISAIRARTAALTASRELSLLLQPALRTFFVSMR